MAVSVKKVGMCKHFHFWTGGILFLHYCARVYRMKTYGRIISLHVFETIHLRFNESMYGWSKHNINRRI